MTNEEQKEKCREWLFGLAKEGCETKFLAKALPIMRKRDDGTNYVKAYMGDDCVIFSPIEWVSMYQMAVSIFTRNSSGRHVHPKGVVY